MNLNKPETATVLAALRYYQAADVGSNLISVSTIATDGGTLTPLDSTGIDDLCERINCEPPETEARHFENYFQHCGEQWMDLWHYVYRDQCPKCGKTAEPYKSIELIHGKTIDHDSS